MRSAADAVGEIYAALQRDGLLENTLDQGMWQGEHDYMDRRWMYEESMRMPLIVRYPRAIRAGSTSQVLISNIDCWISRARRRHLKCTVAASGQSSRPVARPPTGAARCIIVTGCT